MKVQVYFLAYTDSDVSEIEIPFSGNTPITQAIESFVNNNDTHPKGFQLNTGDVILCQNQYYLIEAQGVTMIDQDEFAYYKNIPQRDRLSQWFGEIKSQ